jgi:hypothetical protein
MKSVRQMYLDGLAEYIREHSQLETLKEGTLRGGSTGFITPDGVVLGDASSCPRRAALRSLGYDVDPTTPENQMMFDAGLANEDQFLARMRSQWPGEVLQEEETPINWTTSNGLPVSGRPDLVLLQDGELRIGVEHKGVFSLWTARDVMEQKPKWNNLLQATHYMLKLGLSKYELIYTNRSYFAVNEMAAKLLPNYGETNSQYIDYRFTQWRPKKRGDGYTPGKITEAEYLAGVAAGNRRIQCGDKGWQMEFQAQHGNVTPFCISYEMRLSDSGFVEWRDTRLEKWNTTVINWTGIERFYTVTASMVLDETTSMPPKPVKVKGDGTRTNYSGCDYCPLNTKCNRNEIKTFGQLKNLIDSAELNK